MAVVALRAWNARHSTPARSEEEQERDVQEHLRRAWEEKQRAEAAKDPTYAQVPRFYFRSSEPSAQPSSPPSSASGGGAPAPTDGDAPAPSSASLARHKLLAAARQRLLERKLSHVLDKGQLEALWLELSKGVSHGAQPAAEPRIGYDAFVAVAARMPAPVSDNYMRASHFLKFPADDDGRICITPYFQWVMRRSSLLSSFLEVRAYDSTGTGKLTETQLENYITDLLPALPALEGLQESFIPFYVCTAVRKFLFFLDPKRRGCVRIREMLCSPILNEFNELRRPALSEEETKNNWFSQQTALAVYGEYLQLDTDQNGMLSPGELSQYGGGGLTQPFVQNLFQECQTYDGEIDYKTYLDFVLASWYKKTAESLGYFFRLLDVRRQGYLSSFEINLFFRAVLRGAKEAGQEPVVLEDVRDEIFDMVKPAEPTRITLDDLLACKVGDTVVSMLTDVHGFWAYDNREMLMHNDDNR
ncbi:hypothetical protein KFE25_006022 [Diacronema lutheri]|uniref:Serine/threonine-protein phosphatase 2A regulatory subunit B'' subunit gamma n=1 Tax=Diacronema lutheri TaxID=2081491 RepID=A0A8J6CC64_DIALT|nr:hypothetical protein KFE25_006022 [Diacronema lutheri]